MTKSHSLDVPEIVVINTGPVVSLGRAGALDIVAKLPIRFLSPREVADEIDAGIASGHPVSRPDFVEVAELAAPLSPFAQQTLDKGEAAVIQLALERGIADVCIDEWRGRRAASALGLRVTGSLGLLGRAKHVGLIDAVRPWIGRLLAGGVRYHPDIVQRFLKAMGEDVAD